MDIQEYVEQKRITAERTGHDEGWRRDEDNWDHYAMRIRLKNGSTSRQVTIPWNQGTAHGSATPDAASVFNSLILDAATYADVDSVQEFADEFGYEFETYQQKRRVSKMYTACKEAHTKALRFIGGEEEFDWIRENLDML
jgi:hypothetical protein